MWNNFFVTAIRNLVRNKAFSFLNIGGLALGIASLVLSLLFINNENSFDHFNKNGYRIYRLNEIQNFKGSAEEKVAVSMFPMAPALQKDYPEIAATVRLSDNDDITFKVKEKQLLVKDVINADSSFFTVFDFPLIGGDKKSALAEGANIVITEGIAKSLFGNTDVLGQTLLLNRYGKFENFKVSGILKTLPDNSHLKFEGILPMHSIKMQDWMDSWDANWVTTYLLLKPNINVSHLVHALPAFEKKYLREQALFYKLLLQPLYSIHLDSIDLVHDRNNKKFSRTYLKIFLWVSLFVLLIAILNFINLSTARATNRAREVGIRKSIGSSRWQLIKQFIGEAIFFSMLAFLLSIAICWISLPFLDKMIHRQMVLFTAETISLWVVLIAMVFLLGVLAGIYPAFFISAFKPINVLKGIGGSRSSGGISIRNTLVVVQFTIASVMIISTLVMVKQLNYVKNKDIGFDKDQVLVLPMNATANRNYQALKNDLKANTKVKDVTAFNTVLGSEFGSMGSRYKTAKGEIKNLTVSHLAVDMNYLDFFNIKLIAGRTFSKAFSDSAGHSYIINEALAKKLETNTALGTPYAANWIKTLGSVIGITKNFNFNSLHNKVEPIYISMQNWDYRLMAIKLNAANREKSMAFIENQWKKYVPDMPLTYTFLDDHINSLYQSDNEVSQVVNILTFLAMVIACLGLFGVALYNIETRKMEIGIRKVMGASVINITELLSKQFLQPVFLALIISFPIAWFCLNKWLQNFAFHININIGIFLVCGVIALVMAFLTISLQVIKAANTNPIKNLRVQ